MTSPSTATKGESKKERPNSIPAEVHTDGKSNHNTLYPCIVCEDLGREADIPTI